MLCTCPSSFILLATTAAGLAVFHFSDKLRVLFLLLDLILRWTTKQPIAHQLAAKTIFKTDHLQVSDFLVF